MTIFYILTKDFGEVFRQIYKGCSTFDIENDEEYFTDIGDGAGNTAAYSVTKTTCKDDNCNTEHKEPPMPNDQFATMCQVCSGMIHESFIKFSDSWNMTHE